MKELSIEECRKIQLSILSEIDVFCKENSINYSLSMGSLIGAIRHQGFIPWDDDIDIMMPRKDYEYFLKTYNGKYEVISNKTCKNWWDLYARIADCNTSVVFDNSWYKEVVHGVWVSILPIDNVPDNDNVWCLKYWKICSYLRLCVIKQSKWSQNRGFLWNLSKMFVRQLLKFVSFNFLSLKAEKCLIKYRDIDTLSKTRLLFWCKNIKFPSNVFDSYIDVNFENLRVRSIKDYDKFLSILYGNYMKLPPIEQQVGEHGYRVYLN